MVPSIYDKPPEPWFHVIALAAHNDVLRHDAIKAEPMMRVFAYVDRILYENSPAPSGEETPDSQTQD